jgi:hypothetical protein
MVMRKGLLAAAIAAVCAGASIGAAAEETTTVGGKAYIDFTHIDQKDDGVKAKASGLGLDVKRFYLGVTHGFDEMWSANLTTDFNYVSNDSETQVFVKKAYLQAKLADAAVGRAGSADMPWVPFVENVYGYRYVENTLIDRVKFGTSADWGLHLGGKFADGMVDYALSAVNGNGYKNPTRSKSTDFEGRVGVAPIKGLTLAAGFYNGKLGQDVEGDGAANTASRWDALVAYGFDMFKIGAEYFSAKNFNTKAVKQGPEDKADGYSVFGSVSPMEKVAVFARYDRVKPKKDTSPDLKDTYYNVGVSYQARKNVDLALAYKNEKVDNGSITTASSGTIGGANDGKYSEIGVWTQVQF